jgi:hypothetical protein
VAPPIVSAKLRSPATTLDKAARIIQLALTPVFLLSWRRCAVLAARLARVADQADRVPGMLKHADPVEAKLLETRLRHLEAKIVGP